MKKSNLALASPSRVARRFRFSTTFDWSAFLALPNDFDVRAEYLDKHLASLGAGSSRAVWALDSSRVLKVGDPDSETPKQTRAEVKVWKCSGDRSILAEIYEWAPDYSWVVMERVETPVSTETLGAYLMKALALPAELEFTARELDEGWGLGNILLPFERMDRMSSKRVEWVEENSTPLYDALSRLVEKCSVEPEDFKPDNWGARGNRLVLVDYGYTGSAMDFR